MYLHRPPPTGSHIAPAWRAGEGAPVTGVSPAAVSLGRGRREGFGNYHQNPGTEVWKNPGNRKVMVKPPNLRIKAQLT